VAHFGERFPPLEFMAQLRGNWMVMCTQTSLRIPKACISSVTALAILTERSDRQLDERVMGALDTEAEGLQIRVQRQIV
jgi:hypothetical protein